MNTLIYAGVVAAGAFTLLIEAHRNFNSSLTTIPFKEHPILKNMRVEQLCTSREKTIGFLFYSLLYLVTYAIVLSSTEIYELIQQEQAAGLEIGPITTIAGNEADPATLIDNQYGKPIFISAAIIAIFSIGALRPIETTMRSLAHRLAGVPRGVYLVIEKLHAVSFENNNFSDATPLTTMFQKNAQQDFENSIDKGRIDVITTALQTVDYLSPAITGKQRVQHFPFTQLDAMGTMSDTLEDKVKELRAMLAEPLSGSEEKRQELFDKATSVANDTIALFSVHFLRNNRAIKNIRPNSAIAMVNTEIRRDYHVEANSFAMAVLIALACTICTSFALYYNWLRITSANQAQAARVEAILLDKSPRAVRAAADCTRTPPRGIGLFDGEPSPAENAPSSEPTDAQSDQCLNAWKQAVEEARANRLDRSIINAIRQPLPVAFAVAIAALAAIFGRDIRREDGSWPEWALRRPAFLDLIFMSLMPACLAVLGVTAASFLQFWFEGGFRPTQNAVAFFFATKGIYFAAHLLLGFIVSVGVLVLSDQHDPLKSGPVILLGLAFGIAALVSYYLVVAIGYEDVFLRPKPEGAWFGYPIRETLIYGAMPCFFMIFYAIWLEITEAKPAPPSTDKPQNVG